MVDVIMVDVRCQMLTCGVVVIQYGLNISLAFNI